MKLPLEFCDKVIQDCQDEPTTLSACSLVCKTWMPKSRRLLFRDRFVKPSDKNSQAFLDILSDPKCTVTLFIEALELVFGRLGPQSSIEAGKLLDVIGNFSALEVLSLWIPPGVQLINDPVDPVYDHESLARKARRSLPRLRRLTLDVIWNVFIPWFILPEPSILHLPIVEVMELDLGNFPLLVEEALLQSLLDLYSSTVKELVLHILWENVPALNLGRFTALRSVLFDVGCAPDEDDDEDQLQKLIDIVSTCPNRSREDPLRLIITSEDIEPRAIEGVDWILLDEEAALLL
ncbi:hypothetical protein PQX77_019185 [Marasmius sp. AFHP31]|nr:hypothetical protein PQX77_019185 [Marasmius sp. AFHP31]